VRRLSRRRWGGRELTLAPDRVDEPRDELCRVGDIAPCVNVVLLDELPDERGLASGTKFNPLT
jgi:hypothetical protein